MLSPNTATRARALTPDAATFLVGDVGGTNCRLALAQDSGAGLTLFSARGYKCADFPQAETAIAGYLDALGWESPLRATVIAVAGPVRGGVVQSTNMAWRLSEVALTSRRLGRAMLVNDYTALALSVEHLTCADLQPIGRDVQEDPAAPVAIIGAGTGFGAGVLMRGGFVDVPIATEGGHVSFAPGDDIEIEILRILMRQFGRVSIERLLSGPGLVNLRRALCEIAGRPREELCSEDIVHEAERGDLLSQLALERFCAIYGSVAGDFALAYGARGGIYLGGGIAPAIVARLERSAFRARFEEKGRFHAYMTGIPTQIITNTTAALLGAAHLAWETSAGRQAEQW